MSRKGIRFRLLGFYVLSLAVVQSVAAEELTVLYLKNNGYAAGTVVPSQGSDFVRWKVPEFVSPFDFKVGEISWIRFAASPKDVPLNAEFAIELTGGDQIFGSIIELGETDAILDVPRLGGKLKFSRKLIRSIYRTSSNSNIAYVGPKGLDEWKDVPPPKVEAQPGVPVINRAGVFPPKPAMPEKKSPKWKFEAGHLISDTAGASIYSDLKLPPKAVVELDLAWSTKPDFLIAFGAGNEGALDKSFRLEVWDDDLVVTREIDEDADLASIAKLKPGPGQIQLQLYMDQESGKLIVFSSNSAQATELRAAGNSSKSTGIVRIDNLKGDLRVERIRVSRWNEQPPRRGNLAVNSISLADGTTVEAADLKSSAQDMLEATTDGVTSVIKLADLLSVRFSTDSRSEDRQIRAICHDGTRISGMLQSFTGDAIALSIEGVEPNPSIRLTDIGSVAMIQNATEIEKSTEDVGTFELEKSKLKGRPIDGKETIEASCLTWKPLGSLNASALRLGASGKIVYKDILDPKPTTSQPKPAAVAAPARIAVAQGMLGLSMPNQRTYSTTIDLKKALYLRDGDMIPGEIVKIDEEGVTFKSDVTSGTFVPHSKLKAAIIGSEVTSDIRIDAQKRDRLLTLPRMSRENPPTQLIRSRNGDYLRGRITSMDDKAMVMEVRLDAKQIPRDRISRIIWLHADELEGTNAEEEKEAAKSTRVQVVKSDGIRLTFEAKEVANKSLLGTSDVLKNCNVPFGSVDQILIGDEIRKASSKLALQSAWKLKNAPDPTTLSEEGGGGNAGTDSALVGKPAPDFQLNLLDGKPFKLSEQKGKVVVLDFWATWCGPCLQAMPQVDKVAHEFKDDNVLLVAVNLQETAKQIKPLLERLKLNPTVALDIDGAIAARYQANAIPQTVVIDREGKVTHLFIGGGPRFEDQLRTAVNSVVHPEEKKVEEPVEKK